MCVCVCVCVCVCGDVGKPHHNTEAGVINKLIRQVKQLPYLSEVIGVISDV